MSPLNIGENLANMTPPALTIPACIIADTGVGAATDSINHLWNGNCAAGTITANIMSILIPKLSHALIWAKFEAVKIEVYRHSPVSNVIHTTANNNAIQLNKNNLPVTFAAALVTFQALVKLINSVKPSNVTPQLITIIRKSPVNQAMAAKLVVIVNKVKYFL